MKTMKDVANLYGVHYQTVRNWIKDGEIKSVKVGNTVRISDEEFERLKGRIEQ